jgi:prepilin-type N-terminal cleavage/methylation domain-containing protein/prepilin-type processing-associated H-X9-DG protein
VRSRAFTLIELLIVIAIISLLVAITVPSLARARSRAKTVQCLSNLRQLAIATRTYITAFDGSYPIAQDGTNAWDLTTVTLPGGATAKAPGILYQLPGPTSNAALKIFQCPVYLLANDPAALFTGYNYNTSFIGHGRNEPITRPARDWQVLDPANAALFGDGQGITGPNKFMRCPLIPQPGEGGDASLSFGNSLRAAGTQGFRHDNRTNVAWADGHADTFPNHPAPPPPLKPLLAPTTGFLSSDNSVYDLR